MDLVAVDVETHELFKYSFAIRNGMPAPSPLRWMATCADEVVMLTVTVCVA